jgi:ABC-type Fe3+ transport system substrate-binding protein
MIVSDFVLAVKRALLSFVLASLPMILLADPTHGGEEFKAGSETEWETTLRAAEKEGEVAVFAAGYPHVMEQFQRAYPRIKLVLSVAPRGVDLLNRLMAERRAGKYLADIYTTGLGTHLQLYNAKALVPMPPAFVLPDVKDESGWFGSKHRWGDPEGKRSFVFEGYRGILLHYNTRLVTPADVSKINSWWDLLNPKWKGKIAAYDPFIAGTGRNALWFFYKNPVLGPEFLKKLYGGMEVVIGPDQRLVVDWLANGKVAFCISCPGIPEAKAHGLPVEGATQSLKEGDFTPGGFGVVSLVSNHPHPDAAKVFLNWLLSRQGQITFQETTFKAGEARNSLRIDIPKNTIPPEYLLKDGVQYWREGPTADKEIEEARKLLREIIASK